MPSDAKSSSPPPVALAALELALEQSQQVKAKVEACVEDLSSSNDATKTAIAEGTQLLSAHAVLVESEAVEGRVQEVADDLHDATEALSQGIDDQKLTAAALSQAEQKLAQTQAALVASQVAEKQARLRAMHDSATGLPNRELFDDRLEQAIALAARHHWTLAVMFLDLDGFKAVNDTHGHAAGDAVLKEVAARLQKQSREEDTACRNGGDEFLFLLLNPGDAGNIERLAGLVMTQLEQPITFGALQLGIRLSMGIAIYPQHGTTGEQLVGCADGAMYRAKAKGGGIVVC
ncbi:MAG: GGDEF domain-containing protein [Burkholderiaceae bacterium]|nr:GGDEF domain-containing protein [Burkholderiaceae bacterium]